MTSSVARSIECHASNFTKEAANTLKDLEGDPGRAKQYRAVRSALAKMEASLRYPGLHTHKFKGETCPHDNDLFEAYAQNRTPGAYRIFWCYKPPPPLDTLLIVAITPHP